MRPLLSLSTLALALALVGCDATGPSATADAAVASTDVTEVPYQNTFFVPCAADGAGEDVAVEGSFRVVSHTTTDAAGGVHFTFHDQAVRITGVGLTTGDKYRGAGGVSTAFTPNAGGGPYTNTFMMTFRLVGQGPGNDIQIHQLVHLTVNENGEVTADVDNGTFTCG